MRFGLSPSGADFLRLTLLLSRHGIPHAAISIPFEQNDCGLTHDRLHEAVAQPRQRSVPVLIGHMSILFADSSGLSTDAIENLRASNAG